MAGKNQSADGGGPRIITRSILGVNLLSSGVGNATGSQPSLRMKVNGKGGFVDAFDGRVGPSSSFTAEQETIESLPDRAVVGRKGVRNDQQTQDGVCAIRDAEYIASFPVTVEGQDDKSEYIRQHLLELKASSKTLRPVRIIISLSGIKICCRKGEAEELNSIVANAFKLAYDSRKREPHDTAVTNDRLTGESSSNLAAGGHSNQASFNDIIRGQIEAQKEQYDMENKQREEFLSQQLSLISTPHVDKIVQQRKERQQKELDEFELRLDSSPSVFPDQTPLISSAAFSLSKATGAASSSAVSSSVPVKMKAAAPPPTDDFVSRSVTDLNFSSKMVSTPTTPLQPRNGYTPTPSSPPVGMQESNEQILATIIATLNSSDSRRMHSSPVVIFKEAIDEYFKNSGTSCMSPTRTFRDGSTPFTSVLSERPSPNRSQPPSLAGAVKKPFETFANRSGNWQPAQLPAESTNGVGRIASLRGANPKPAIGQPVVKAEEIRGSWSPSMTGGPARQRQGISMAESTSVAATPSRAITNRNTDRESSADITALQPLVSASTTSLKVIGGEDDRNLPQAPWYQPGLQREIALDMLSRQDAGHFIVRDSTTHPGCYALSIKVPESENASGITHYLILKTEKGTFRIKGLGKEWSSLTALVIHHTVMKELLPCVLIVPNNDELKNY